MKKFLIFFIIFLSNFYIFSQSIEKLHLINDIYTIVNNEDYEFGKGLNNIFIDEINNFMTVDQYYLNSSYLISLKKTEYPNIKITTPLRGRKFGAIQNYGKYNIVHEGYLLKLYNHEGDLIVSAKETSGVSFVLKVSDKLYVFFINPNGIPGAFDTEGNVYNNYQVYEILKKFDSNIYMESEKYAELLQIKGLFDLNQILIWNGVYYSSASILNNFWDKDKSEYLFVSDFNPLIYDYCGNAYQIKFSKEKEYNKLVAVSKDGKRLFNPIRLEEYSEILQALSSKNKSDFNGVWNVLLSGNIYFVLCNTRETEVFRIRNTWDSTNLYALAINGYTEDFYGDYVKEVLPKMSKADLRLLRNTVFALYGVHFKSEDLAKYFDKQVWYTDEGKSSGEVTLPENRQKLVEMILKLEK